jgi:hypothetical protein
MHQLGPQLFDQLAHRIRDGFNALEGKNFLVYAFDLVRQHDAAIEDARFIGIAVPAAVLDNEGTPPGQRLQAAL